MQTIRPRIIQKVHRLGDERSGSGEEMETTQFLRGRGPPQGWLSGWSEDSGPRHSSTFSGLCSLTCCLGAGPWQCLGAREFGLQPTPSWAEAASPWQESADHLLVGFHSASQNVHLPLPFFQLQSFCQIQSFMEFQLSTDLKKSWFSVSRECRVQNPLLSSPTTVDPVTSLWKTRVSRTHFRNELLALLVIPGPACPMSPQTVT